MKCDQLWHCLQGIVSPGTNNVPALPYPLHSMITWRPGMESIDTPLYRELFADRSFREAVKAEALTTSVPVLFSYHSFRHMRVKIAKICAGSRWV